MTLQLTDLPDAILLRIFSSLLNTHDITAPLAPSPPLQQTSVLTGNNDNSSNSGKSSSSRNPKRPTSSIKRARLAGLSAQTFCRLCCVSRRFNHLASADQLWQPLTLARFPDRHWLTSDPKVTELIRVRKEHQKKLRLDRQQHQHQEKDSLETLGGSNPTPDPVTEPSTVTENGDQGSAVPSQEEAAATTAATTSKPKRTKFYSRFEQRAHRRRFVDLDPELNFTALAWTNTLWTWKRTFFGDCRFVESKDVLTPNRIDHVHYRNNAQDSREECSRCWRPTLSCICSALTPQLYCNCRVRILILQHPRCQVSIGTIRILKMTFKYCQVLIGKDFHEKKFPGLEQMLQDPNCTPLLLYPSHGAADIHSIASTLLQPNNPSSQSSDDTPSQYRCQGCTHPDPIYPGEDGPSLIANVPSKFPYRLIIAFDGSWSHAKIMYRCNPRLQQLTTQIKLPNPPPAVYHQLKQEPKETYTSTAEAVGQAVALLGWPGPQTELESESQDVGIKVDRLGKTSVNYTPLLMKDITRPIEKIIDLQRPFAQEEQAALENQGE